MGSDDRPTAGSGPASRGRPPKFWTLGLPLVVSGIILAILFRATDVNAIWAALVQAQPLPLGLAAAFIAGTLFARAVRFHFMWPKNGERHTDFAASLRSTSLHHAAFASFPSGAGDITLPFIARSYLKVSLSDATIVLLLSRLQDAIVLLGLAAAAFAVRALEPIFAGPFALLLLATTVFAGGHLHRAARLLAGVLGAASHYAPSFLAHPLVRLTESLAESIERYRYRPNHPRLLVIWPAVAWMCASLSVTHIFGAFGQSMAFVDAVLLVAGLNIVGALAVFTVAGFGVAEAGLAGLLISLGWPAEASWVSAWRH